MSPFACVRVPFFAVAAVERCEPALRERPLAVVGETPAGARVVEANEAAREQGVRPEMTMAEARARCVELVSRPFSAAAVESAQHALLEAALTVSPRVEDARPGLVNVETAGLARLVGDPAAVGRRLTRQAQAVGLSARVGVAGSRAAARVAAAGTDARVTVVPAGRERAWLASAPLVVLDLAPDLAAAFGRWGVRTLGELAALPREGLAARLGRAGLEAHDLACGRDRAPFQPYTPPPYWEEAQGLEWELDSLDALTRVLETVLERLCVRLTAAHLAADALDVRLQLASGGRDERTVPLAVPMRDAGSMLALVRVVLEAHPPRAAITHVALSAHPVRARAGQGGLWRPSAPALRDLGAVLARLVALVGASNLGSPRLVDSRRPDAFRLASFLPPADADAGGAEAGTVAPPARLVLRRLSPPRPVAVEGDGERPGAVGGRRIVACAGPWRASGEWWDVRAWARDEWDAALDDGTVCRLARDLRTGEWCVDGVYD